MQDRTIYIDNAATAQKPQCVIDAESRFYEVNNANPLRGFYPLSLAATKEYEDAREVVRQFLNADSDKEIIFTRNTTESLNLVAYSYGINNLKAGDEIVVDLGKVENLNNIYIFGACRAQNRAQFRYIVRIKTGNFQYPDKRDKNFAIFTDKKLTDVKNICNCRLAKKRDK